MTSLSSVHPSRRIAVVGAGLAGLICARTLAKHGLAVTVLDKGRRPGGRTATKRLADGYHGDHGAPVLDLDPSELPQHLEHWRDAGVLADWPAVGRTVAQPTTRALAEHLAAGLNIHQGTAVQRIHGHDGGWALTTSEDVVGLFERVVLAIPAPQTTSLLQPIAPTFAAMAQEVHYTPCMSALAVFSKPPETSETWLTFADGVLGQAIRDSAKPGRTCGGIEVWALHATPAWSEVHKDDSFDQIAQALLADFKQRMGSLPDPIELIGHRWRYAKVDTPVQRDCLFDREAGIGVCGDWCLGATAGHAIQSGLAMADQLLAEHKAAVTATAPIEISA